MSAEVEGKINNLLFSWGNYDNALRTFHSGKRQESDTNNIEAVVGMGKTIVAKRMRGIVEKQGMNKIALLVDPNGTMTVKEHSDLMKRIEEICRWK